MSTSVIVFVIGAGFHGLIAARRFLEIYPQTDLTIFEADAYLGGVWSRERVYDELFTESSSGMYEYSDEPIVCDRLTGKDISVYLECYARTHHLYERIRFNTRVKTFTRLVEISQWQLEFDDRSDVARCDKLIVATGLTSSPSIPTVPISSESIIAQYHVRSLAKISLRSTEERVIVVGGAKSAYDATYSMVKQGAKSVTLVIKETNPGPAWLLPEHIFFNIHTDKLIGTRLAAALTPNIWFPNTWSHYFLHQTTVGKWLVANIWRWAEEFIKYRIGYEQHDELKKLAPESGSLFWSGTNTCILNHPDLLDMIKCGRILVKRSTVVKIVGSNTVQFADGSQCQADLLIWATGWKSTLSPPSKICNVVLEQQAEAYVLDQCPALRHGLATKATLRPCSFTLYRRLVPLDYIHDHSIVYVGMLQSPGTGVLAEVQAVWSAIYLMNDLQIHDNAEWETVITNIWLSKRYAMVQRHAHYAHDFIRYADLLLMDLGLEPMRKNGWWHREIIEPYMAKDYQGLAAEWLAKQQKTQHTNQFI